MLAPLPRCATTTRAVGARPPITSGQHAGDIFIGKAVKAVAPDAFLGELRGNANAVATAGCERWNEVSKHATCGSVGMKLCKCRDGGEVMRLMQRRQRNEAGQLGDHLRIDANRRRVAHPAMHHAVAGCDQFLVREVRSRASPEAPPSASSWSLASA